MVDRLMFMDIEKRALYNALRMNWLEDRSLKAEPWQVEDYRDMPAPLIFSRLRQFRIDLDEKTFMAIADQVDTPEELTEAFLADMDAGEKEEDQIYLLVFELWRKLKADKPCLSVFCDELDHLIYLYDQRQIENPEQIEDILANLEVILDENIDGGIRPENVLESVNRGCANDIEAFLYDFIVEQIENDNLSYASDLLDSFEEYVVNAKWFDLLRIKIYSETDPESSEVLIGQLAEEAVSAEDLEFNLELLNEMVHGGAKEIFARLVEKSIGLLEQENDFKDLLHICGDYLRCLDLDEEERKIQKIIEKRKGIGAEAPFKHSDPDAAELAETISAKA